MSELPALNLRVKEIVDKCFNGNVTAFARVLGYSSPQKVNRLFNVDQRSGKYPEPSTSIITDIITKISNINKTWLISGEGTMLQESGQPSSGVVSNARFRRVSDLNVTIAPLIGQYAHAGYLSGFADVEYLDRQPMYVATQKYSGDRFVAFEVRGDSMFDSSYRSICSRDVVLGREYVRDNGSPIPTPSVYIIVHRDDGVVIKYVVDHREAEGIITCESYNPDKLRYPTFELHLKDVLQLFTVVEIKRDL